MTEPTGRTEEGEKLWKCKKPQWLTVDIMTWAGQHMHVLFPDILSMQHTGRAFLHRKEHQLQAISTKENDALAVQILYGGKHWLWTASHTDKGFVGDSLLIPNPDVSLPHTALSITHTHTHSYTGGYHLES
jgi:hypothetical protein